MPQEATEEVVWSGSQFNVSISVNVFYGQRAVFLSSLCFQCVECSMVNVSILSVVNLFNVIQRFFLLFRWTIQCMCSLYASNVWFIYECVSIYAFNGPLVSVSICFISIIGLL